MPEPRRTFAPVLLAGLPAAVLTLVAANQDWAAVDPDTVAEVQGAAVLASADEAQMPVAGALALVLLASWGALLVTRGVVRRGVAVLGLLAALGVAGTVVVGHGSTRDSVRAAFEQVGAGGVETGTTGWFWAAAVGALVSVATTAAALRFAGSWPAMGSRYDAPGARRAEEPDVRAGEAGAGDLWRSIDEGHDPTA